MSSDPARGLAEALRSATFGTFRGFVRVEVLASRSWASGTISGVRHRLSLDLEGPGAAGAAAGLSAGLGAYEFALPDHFVADVAVVDMAEDGENLACLTLEALTVEAD